MAGCGSWGSWPVTLEGFIVAECFEEEVIKVVSTVRLLVVAIVGSSK